MEGRKIATGGNNLSTSQPMRRPFGYVFEQTIHRIRDCFKRFKPRRDVFGILNIGKVGEKMKPKYQQA